MTVKCIQSSLIKNVKHGFFTRKGGSSLGIYKGLNCGFGSKDHKENVIRNRTIVAQHMGTSIEKIVSVHQIHSNRAIICDQKFDVVPKADAIVTNTPGLLLSDLAQMLATEC